MRTTAIALVALLTLTAVSVPVARAGELWIQIIDSAEKKSPEYLDFFSNFSTTLIEGLEGLKKSGELKSVSSDYWIILLSTAISMTGETLVEIHAIRGEDPRRLPILIATISERSDAATIRTAARSAQRLIVETATQQRETPPQPPTPAQKLRTKNPRTKTSAGASFFMLS